MPYGLCLRPLCNESHSKSIIIYDSACKIQYITFFRKEIQLNIDVSHSLFQVFLCLSKVMQKGAVDVFAHVFRCLE